MENERIAAFRRYAERFLPLAGTDAAFVAENIHLKIDHTLRVYALAADLAEAEHFTKQATRLLKLSALYHDLARFEQFTQYRTFNDLASFDHGARAAELIAETHLLDDLPQENREIVVKAVAAHNKRVVPDDYTGELLSVTRALRDCDKIDIMPITIAFLAHPANDAVAWGLPRGEHLSATVALALKEHRSPAYSDFRNELDFIASKLAWQFDLGFDFSRKKFAEGRFLEKIRSFLPQTAEFDNLISSFFEEKELPRL